MRSGSVEISAAVGLALLLQENAKVTAQLGGLPGEDATDTARRQAAINPQTVIECLRPKFLAFDQVADFFARPRFDLEQPP